MYGLLVTEIIILLYVSYNKVLQYFPPFVSALKGYRTVQIPYHKKQKGIIYRYGK